MKKRMLWVAGMAACMICLSGCASSLSDVSDTVDEAVAYVQEKAEDFTTKDEEKTADQSDEEAVSETPADEEPADEESASDEMTSEATAGEESVTEEQESDEPVSEEPDEKKILLPISAPVDMVFSSGAGAWGTEMTLHPDGTFEGQYVDSDSGDIGENYNNGVTYIATFTGKFDDIEQVNDYAYRMILTEVNIEETEEWIENGVKYIPSDVYGISGGDVFYFLTDKTPMNALTEDCMSWTRNFFIEEHQETLMRYGLYNALQGYAFFEQKLDEY